MAFQYETGGDLTTGGTWVSEPGTYHLLVTGIEEQPTKSDGTPIDNAAFKVDASVLGGTVPNQKDKVLDIVLFYPKPSDKNEGAFAKKKFDRFFLATGLASKEDLEQKDRQLSIDLQAAVGRNFVAKFEKETTKSGKERISLAFAEIYHVDDPAVKDIPKDADSLAMIDPKLRWIGERAPAAPAPAEASPPPVAEAATAAPTNGGNIDYSEL